MARKSKTVGSGRADRRKAKAGAAPKKADASEVEEPQPGSVENVIVFTTTFALIASIVMVIMSSGRYA